MASSKSKGANATFDKLRSGSIKIHLLGVVGCLIFGGSERFDFFRLEAREFSVASHDCVLPEASFALKGSRYGLFHARHDDVRVCVFMVHSSDCVTKCA